MAATAHWRTAGGPGFRTAIAFSLGLVAWLSGALSRSGAQAAGEPVAVTGVVLDAGGKAVPGASVHLRGDAQAGRTDGSGAFALRAARQAQYDVVAEGPDQRRGELISAAPAGLRVVLQPAMEFSDKPDFAVAGITDWTAVGGHGSDTVLRTSEDLARETASLGSQGGVLVSGVDVRRERALQAELHARPDSYQANRELGELYLKGLMPREASGPLERAAALHGHAADDEYLAAEACEGEGDFRRALEHVRLALKAADRAEFHRLAGELEEQLGDPVAAEREYARAAGLEPSEANLLAWGSELLVHRAVVQAAEVFARGVRLHPESARLKTGWGAALFAEAKYDEAASQLCSAFDLDPSSRETYGVLGRVGLGSPAREPCVEERLLRYANEHPADAEASYNEAMALVRGGDRDGAGKLLAAAVALRPGYAEAHVQLGILLAAARDNAGAEREFLAAIAADPALAEAHYRLGVLYDRTGRAAEAKREFGVHERLGREQAKAVERERQGVKQFVVAGGP